MISIGAAGRPGFPMAGLPLRDVERLYEPRMVQTGQLRIYFDKWDIFGKLPSAHAPEGSPNGRSGYLSNSVRRWPTLTIVQVRLSKSRAYVAYKFDRLLILS
jgi:hypothetical protein